MKVELLYFEGCASYGRLLPHLNQLLLDAGVERPVELRRIESEQDAVRERFLGSPTIRIDGHDVEPGAEARADFGIKCRLYRDGAGHSPIPPDAWIVASLERAGAASRREHRAR